MANVKNYGISGVSGSVELGKAGPVVEHSSGGNVDVKDSASAYTHVSGADGVAADNFVTRRQYDVLDDIIDKLVPGSLEVVRGLGSNVKSNQSTHLSGVKPGCSFGSLMCWCLRCKTP